MANEPLTSHYLLFLALIVAVACPPVCSIFVNQHIRSVTSPEKSSTSELERLRDARRYALQILIERDDWYLSLESVVDGVSNRAGGSSVIGHTESVLLIRQLPDTRTIEYCWHTDSQLSRGLSCDPLVDAGVTQDRSAGQVISEVWLVRGLRTSLRSNKAAEFEVRVHLRSPDHDVDA